MANALILDLDDVLVSAEEFANSAFAVVADYLAARHGWTSEPLKAEFLRAWRAESGDEGAIVDAMLAKSGVAARDRYPILHLLHCHEPSLALFADANEFLERTPPRFRVGILTGGHPMSQRNKVRVLELLDRVDEIVIQADGGEPWQRQPALPMLALCRALEVSPKDCIYVGDHPEFDCATAARLGMTAVRMRRGRFAGEEYPYIKFAGEITKLTELLSGGYLRSNQDSRDLEKHL